MGRVSDYVSRKSGSFPNFMARKSEAYLPISTKPQSKFRVKALLGNCLYRRVVIWTFLVIALLSFTLFNPGLAGRPRDVLDLVHGSINGVNGAPQATDNVILQTQDSQDDVHIQDPVEEEKEPVEEMQEQEEEKEEENPEDEKEEETEENANSPHWLRYKQ